MIEGAPKQTKCNGTLPHDLVPRTLVDLLLKINEPKKRRRFYEEKKGSYRNHGNGDGVCRKCKKHKKCDEFPTRFGLICKECQPLDKRTKKNNPGGNNKTGKNGRKRV